MNLENMVSRIFERCLVQDENGNQWQQDNVRITILKIPIYNSMSLYPIDEKINKIGYKCSNTEI